MSGKPTSAKGGSQAAPKGQAPAPVKVPAKSKSSSSSESSDDEGSGKKIMKQVILSAQDLKAASDALIAAVGNFAYDFMDIYEFEGFQVIDFRNALLSMWAQLIGEFASDLFVIFGLAFMRGTKLEKIMNRTRSKGAKRIRKLKKKHGIVDSAAGKNNNAVSVSRLSAGFPDILAECLLAYLGQGLQMRDFGIVGSACPKFLAFPGGAIFAANDVELSLHVAWAELFHKAVKKVDPNDEDKAQIKRFAGIQYQSPLRQTIKQTTWDALRQYK
jgi:hypothetical protein